MLTLRLFQTLGLGLELGAGQNEWGYLVEADQLLARPPCHD